MSPPVQPVIYPRVQCVSVNLMLAARLRPKSERTKASYHANPSPHALLQQALPPGSTHVSSGPTATKNQNVDFSLFRGNGQLPSSPESRKQSTLSTTSMEKFTSLNAEPAPQSQRSLASDSLAPFGLLRRSATAGNFTIANILNAEDEPTADHAHRQGDKPEFGNDRVNDMNDPINRNLLDLATAQDLFNQ
ncbi:hypothetical protein FQN50_009296 [Emmonsiellopsis sp. PD_5]|nr:hypothetical protein FQN50_009296 [Emmonsiellopsis sp. PD_5]